MLLWAVQIKVVGNWMSKIEGLLRRILRLNQIAPQEKCLVFSQYPDALKLVGKALTVNNIGWVELRGGAKVTLTTIMAPLFGRLIRRNLASRQRLGGI